MYLDTLDGVITQLAEEVPCTSVLPTMFQINEKWFYKNPHFISGITPITVHPENNEFEFHFLNKMINTGIYSPENVRNKTRFINLHASKSQQIDGLVKYFQPLNITEGNSLSMVLSAAVQTAILSANNFWRDDIVILGAYVGLISGILYFINVGYYIIILLEKIKGYRKKKPAERVYDVVTTTLGEV